MNGRMGAVLSVVVALACGGVIESEPGKEPSGQGVGIAISPLVASVTTGGTAAFDAEVTGTADTDVSWRVEEGDAGGTVTASGLYTAPPTTGSFHVLVASAADAGKTARATVTVSEPPPPPPPPGGVVAAFPGAQGGGALSKGGRGGAVIEVTNLNDSGPGSLRACVDASGPRTCIFRVGGTIGLLSALQVRNPYLTIAGQSAPGGGIQLTGKGITVRAGEGAVLYVATHDVTVRYLRLRKGYSGLDEQLGDAVTVDGGAYNVIVDHCSLSWANDETVGVWDNTTRVHPHNLTFSWNMYYEPLAGHDTNFITGSDLPAIADAMTDIDLHHNFFGNSSHRNPLIKTKRSRIVNNIVYDWNYYCTETSGGVHADIVNNLYKSGPRTDPPGADGSWEVMAYPLAGSPAAASGTASLYVSGNKGPNDPSPTATSNWTNMVRQVSRHESNFVNGLLPAEYRRATRLPPPEGGIDITPEDVASLEGKMLSNAAANPVGASRRLDCLGNWVDVRDAADTRVVNEYHSGGGTRAPVTEDDVGGFPAIAAGTACADADRDGMPDAWETAQGLKPNDASDANAVGPGGFTNLELYLAGPR